MLDIGFWLGHFKGKYLQSIISGTVKKKKVIINVFHYALAITHTHTPSYSLTGFVLYLKDEKGEFRNTEETSCENCHS